MTRIQQLYLLQQTDSELDQIHKRLKFINDNLVESKELLSARHEKNQAETTLNSCRTKLNDLSLEVKGQNEKIKANENKLYSGRGGNPKELKSLQDELTALKKWLDKREEDQLQAMIALEEAETRFSENKQKLEIVLKKWTESQGSLGEEKKGLEEKELLMQIRREEIGAGVTSPDLKVYEDLRRKKAGKAVAPVKNGVCQLCGTNPPTGELQKVQRGNEIILCFTCGRILAIT